MSLVVSWASIRTIDIDGLKGLNGYPKGLIKKGCMHRVALAVGVMD